MFRTLNVKSPRLFSILGIGLAQESKNPAAMLCNRIALSLFIVASLMLLFNWELNIRHQVSHLTTYFIDGGVWLILLFNYGLLILAVKNKKKMLKDNWLQPFLIIAGAVVLFHHAAISNQIVFLKPLLAILILLPALRFLFSLFVDGYLWTTVLATLIIITFFGILASVIDPSIGSVGNGLWWALATVSTVGYGDIVPHTVGGRILGTLLIGVGLGLFAIITANVVRIMLSKEAESLNITKPKLDTALQEQLNLLFSNQKKMFTMLESIKKELDQLDT